ncbi:alpha/beta-hydrolase [Xylaria sp. CBS 124048]|nr:alpha/beta-hydrolase [Xylaria sp. CBS 124048]
MNTATVSMAVTPTALSTFLSHYFNRKTLRQQPTAHLSYDEGLHMIRAFLSFASQHTIEDLQAFTSQRVPYPRWVKVKEVEIPEDALLESANALQEQLGPEGIKKVGGRNWWQWRLPQTPLKAEWIEMRSDYNKRKKSGDPGKRVMLYVHGGGYYFGSVDEHRYQMQRHARKLQARVFAPRYRLAPQFPFPCGLQDCLAAYLYLLKTAQDPSTIILAGDSAGGGMVLSMLVTIRDQGLPPPAGAILISPWVDLTHSFPSVSGDCPLDYIPSNGFHHKPSPAWPPLNADEFAALADQVASTRQGQKLKKPASVDVTPQSQDLEIAVETTELKDGSPAKSWAETTHLSIPIDGKEVLLKDQFHMYTTNELLSHPLVSPVMQPSLGGLPPLLIMTGGGEILRDEQIYLAHKCADPEKYQPSDVHMDDAAREQISRFKPTDVQLQIWDDLCHVAPTLSFTRPAKYLYRSIAQFGAWALARAQETQIEVLEDDDISVISSSASDNEREAAAQSQEDAGLSSESAQIQVGKAGDPLPPFKNHMLRQRVSRHGIIRPLEPAGELSACNLDPAEIGVIKEKPVRRWLETRRQWDNRFSSTRAKIHKRRLKEMMEGYQGFDGEMPPPSALAARRKAAGDLVKTKDKKSMGLALWSLWGSKHDEMEMQRKEEAGKSPETRPVTGQEIHDPHSQSEIEEEEGEEEEEKDDANQELPTDQAHSIAESESEHEHENEHETSPEHTSIAVLMAKREGRAPPDATGSQPPNGDPDPNAAPFTGVTGKRPIVGGIAVPFSLGNDAETASMITLNPSTNQSSRAASRSSLGAEMDRAFATRAIETTIFQPGTTTTTGDSSREAGPTGVSSELEMLRLG